MSADVTFDIDEMMFCFVLNVDRKPAYANPVTPFNGPGATRSPFVTFGRRGRKAHRRRVTRNSAFHIFIPGILPACI
ncbi:MAG TPA: hypothetical protein VHV26_03240 [Rhizomicrobium sp.]|jgi:hypothetical protein|nr:hypothetical protein [Rhizomicrobium sp.]